MKNWERWFLPFAILVVAVLGLPGMDSSSSKWVIVQAVAIIGAALALFFKPVLPDMERGQWAALAVVWLGFLAHLFWFQPSGYEFSLVSRFSFFALLWCSWKGFSSDGLRWQDFFWPLAAVIVFSFGVHFFAATDPLLLSLALLLFFTLPAPAQSYARFLRWAVGALGITGMLLAGDLPSMIALVSGFLVMLTAVFTTGKRVDAAKTFLPVGVVAAGGLFLFGAVQTIRHEELRPAFTRGIHDARSLRKDVWRATTRMIKAAPLGAGTDRFAFSYVPHYRGLDSIRDTHTLNSPGNEFLRYGAEDGLPLAFVYLGIFAYFLFAWRKKGAAHRQIILPFLAFLLAAMVVASPWLNPSVFALSAVVMGAMGAGIWKRRMLPAHAGTRATLIILLLGASWFWGKVAVSHALERSDSAFNTKVSCRALPSNWRACLNYGRILLDKGETAEARREVESVLERDPWNFIAIRTLGSVALKQGDRLEACFLTWKYDDIFAGRSELAQEYAANCPPKWREYFTRKRPQKYYRK